MDLYDINVLREQLIGVDSLYMQGLVEALSKSDKPLDYNYFCKILDEVF